ncbi:MAG TPA: dihydroorotate dehydrogenase electron transfer subunit, partial [Actinomycetes bacterium]
MTPVRELCEVLERRRVGAYHALTLLAPRIAGQARPGQFVHLLAGEDRSFPLRRPFSIHRVERPGAAPATVEVVFDVVGPGTRALAELRTHDLVDGLGPLGR